jgi:hypothetical protein
VVTIRHRLRAFFDVLLREPVVEVPAPTPPIREGQEVWGATRTPQDGWRSVGRAGEPSPLDGLIASGDRLTSARASLRAAGDVPAVSEEG